MEGAFEKINWSRPDFFSIIECGGVLAIDDCQLELCQTWCLGNGYIIKTLDCRQGIDYAVLTIGKMFDWEKQFGYTLEASDRNYHRLNDGFYFEIEEGGGLVLELLGAETAWNENPKWFTNLLYISRRHSICQLSIGRRFFVSLPLEKDSPVRGIELEGSAQVISSRSWKFK